MKISSSIICWNEVQTIDLTLKSIKGFADEVIIIDTGSFDGTVKKAREWIAKLDLNGRVESIRIKQLVDARLKAFKLCKGDWVLMQDANLVLSNSLKKEMLGHIRRGSNVACNIKSLNLMGDYEHYFSNLPFMAPHRIFVKRSLAKWALDVDRPHFSGSAVNLSNWAVNLSRVRPAWRCWYRGEPFDRRYYKEGNRNWAGKTNTQRQWMNSNRYYSIVEYIEAEKGLTLEDANRIAPSWYLKQLQIEAKPLKPELRSHLPETIKQELKNPRYKLIKKNGKIIGRQPSL